MMGVMSHRAQGDRRKSAPTWCLSIHALWRCQHSGACCRAGWSIPVEASSFERLHQHFGTTVAERLLVTGGPLPEGAAAFLGAAADGTCRFFEGQRCKIHRELGADALPVACQQFPRIVLQDERGIFVTLSHFCPTAARLLLQDDPLEIIEAPAGLSLNGAVEGLDATGVLPPLLRRGMLTDLAGYGAWEHQALDVLACGRWMAGESLGRIGAATDRLLSWDPAREPLAAAVTAAFDGAEPGDVQIDWDDDARRYRMAASAVSPGLAASPLPAGLDEAWRDASTRWPAFDRATRSYLAAHLFGNWLAYHAGGLATVVEFLRVCLAVLRVEMARRHLQPTQGPAQTHFVEAVRQADLLLVHLVDARVLARAIEHDEHFRSRTFPPLRHDRHSIG